MKSVIGSVLSGLRKLRDYIYNNRYNLIVFSLIFYFIFDLISTAYGLSHGAQERNEYFATATITTMIIAKAAVVVMFCGFLYYTKDTKKEYLKNISSIIVTEYSLIGAYIFVNNTYQIIHYWVMI